MIYSVEDVTAYRDALLRLKEIEDTVVKIGLIFPEEAVTSDPAFMRFLNGRVLRLDHLINRK